MGDSENLTVLPDYQVVDCSGRYVMPGLIERQIDQGSGIGRICD